MSCRRLLGILQNHGRDRNQRTCSLFWLLLRRSMRRASSYTPTSGITRSLTSHESVTQKPSFKGDVVARIVAGARKEKYQLFFALCGGTGLRFGEALGIKVQNISPECSTIKIVQKAWRSQIQNFLKTDSDSREIDLCPALASMLKEYLDKDRERLGPTYYSNQRRVSLFTNPTFFGALYIRSGKSQ